MNLPRTASTSAARFFGRRGSARHAKGHTRNTRKAVYGERSISSPKRCLAKQQLKTKPLKPLALTESPEHHVQLVAGRPGPSNATFHALSGESQVGDSQHAHSSPSCGADAARKELCPREAARRNSSRVGAKSGVDFEVYQHTTQLTTYETKTAPVDRKPSRQKL